MTCAFADFAPLLAEQAEFATNPIAGLIGSLALVISGLGVAVIAWGAYTSALRLIASETAAARGQLPKADAAASRFLFSTYLLPGLDFMTAGSVIKTLVAPDWQQAALLASLVFARTLVGLGARWGVPPAVGLTATVPGVTEQLAAPLRPLDRMPSALEESAPVGAPTAP
jgi:uncharacterized membrane protein